MQHQRRNKQGPVQFVVCTQEGELLVLENPSAAGESDLIFLESENLRRLIGRLTAGTDPSGF